MRNEQSTPPPESSPKFLPQYVTNLQPGLHAGSVVAQLSTKPAESAHANPQSAAENVARTTNTPLYTMWKIPPTHTTTPKKKVRNLTLREYYGLTNSDVDWQNPIQVSSAGSRSSALSEIRTPGAYEQSGCTGEKERVRAHRQQQPHNTVTQYSCCIQDKAELYVPSAEPLKY